MARLDVLRSLLREAARAGVDRLGARDLARRVGEVVAKTAWGGLEVSDAEMTAAVARVAGIAAATVTSVPGAVCVDASLDGGETLRMRLLPRAVKFAPGGAKEVAFRAEPPETLDRASARDACAALAGAIAHALWRPALHDLARSDPSAFAIREGDVVTLDLRSVPAVRAALRTAVGATLIEALALRAFDARPGGLVLRLAIPGLAPWSRP